MRIIDGAGRYLIPGLWDMHVHTLMGDWMPGATQITLPLFVANGITGVRTMGDELPTILQWRDEASGTFRFLTAGTGRGRLQVVTAHVR